MVYRVSYRTARTTQRNPVKRDRQRDREIDRQREVVMSLRRDFGLSNSVKTVTDWGLLKLD